MQQLEQWAHAHLWTFATTFSWAALTIFLGLREQWRAVEHLLTPGGISENTRGVPQEMLGSGDENAAPVPRQDPEDGLWYVPTFDPATGRRSGKRAVDAPNLQAPRISSGNGHNNARGGWFRA